jgi:chitosanase
MLMKLRGRTAALAATAVVATAVPFVMTFTAEAATGPTATFSKVSDWGSGWQAQVVVANGGSSAVSSWKVEFDLPSGTTVGTYWDTLMTSSGQHFTFTNRSWNGAVAPGSSVTFGLLGSGSGSPSGCTLNNAPCGGGTVVPPTPGPTTTVTTPPVTAPPTTRPPTTAPTTRPPTTAPTTLPPVTTAPPSNGVNLDDPKKKDVAMQIVSTAENSSTDWRAQFGYIEDIGDGRGYTAGIIGFCSGTSDMLALVQEYTQRKPGNVLEKYLPALRGVNGSDSHAGLDPNYTHDWKTAAADPVFQKAQEDERDRVYFNPSVTLAKQDGVRALGQFAYYDAAVMHGPSGMRSVRTAALRVAKPPAQGGNETTWLNAFLDARVVEMKKEAAHEDTSRVDTAQRVFLRNGNLDLNIPLTFAVYGETFTINN